MNKPNTEQMLIAEGGSTNPMRMAFQACEGNKVAALVEDAAHGKAIQELGQGIAQRLGH